MSQHRQPAGVPSGGQFAPGTHSEADVGLGEPAEVVTPGDVIDYLGQFGDGDEVTISDLEVFFEERGGSVDSDAGHRPPPADVSKVLATLIDDAEEADDVDRAIAEAAGRLAGLDVERTVDVGDGRSLNVKLTGEGVIVDVIGDGEVMATSSQTFDELADATEATDPLASSAASAELADLRRLRQEAWDEFQSDGGRGVDQAERIDDLDRQIAVAEAEARAERAGVGLRNAQRAVVESSTAIVAAAVLREEPDAAVVVAVSDDEYPEIVYLAEVRDRAGVTIGERFEDPWVSTLDDGLREHLGDVARFGDYDLSGGGIIELDLTNGTWSA